VPLLIAYKSFILPLVSYCSSVWSPHLLGDIYAIESVQRLFTRKLAGFDNMTYPDRLKALNLPSLELRRLRSDLVFCFKIVNGLVAGDLSSYGLRQTKSSTRGHSQKLFVEHSKLDARRYFFSNRIIKPWNALPAETIASPSVFFFKRSLLKCNLEDYVSLKVNSIK